MLFNCKPFIIYCNILPITRSFTALIETGYNFNNIRVARFLPLLKKTAMKNTAICVLPPLSGLGGPASFLARLTDGLRTRGYAVIHDPLENNCVAVLLIGGTTRYLPALWQTRQRGVRIVQRLNGMNWLHRQRRVSLRYYLRCEWNNYVLAIIRRQLASRIIYQSHFSQSWWERVYSPLEKRAVVQYNSVDLTKFSPIGEHQRPGNHWRILVVEGQVGGGYEQGLEHAVQVARLVQLQSNRPVELMVVGKVWHSTLARWQQEREVTITWRGIVEHQYIPEIDRSAHVLFSADLNAACPNAVVEALACGLPVIGFATGALPELVTDGAGELAPYGGDVWKLDPPDLPALAEAALKVLADQENYRRAARRRAEQVFDLQQMIDVYLEELLG